MLSIAVRPPQKASSANRCSQKAKSPRDRTSTVQATMIMPSPNQTETSLRSCHEGNGSPKIHGATSIESNQSATATGAIRKEKR